MSLGRTLAVVPEELRGERHVDGLDHGDHPQRRHDLFSCRTDRVPAATPP